MNKKANSNDVPHAKDPGKEREQEKDDRPDYGGLPDRDLKKNLGCG